MHASILQLLSCDYEAVRKRRRQLDTGPSPNNFHLISSLLPTNLTLDSNEDDEDSDTEEILREATLLLLRILYAQSQSQLESMDQELELLRHAPPPSAQSQQGPKDRDDSWKLDIPLGGGPDGKGPLLDSEGKVSLRLPIILTGYQAYASDYSLCDPSRSYPRVCQNVLAYRDRCLVLDIDFRPCR